MARCTFCRRKTGIHEMETKRTGEDGQTRYYCSLDCLREERRTETFREGVAELTAAVNRIADAMESDTQLVAEQR